MTQKGRDGWQKTRGVHTGEMVSEIHVVEQQKRSEEWCSVYSPAGITGKVLYSGTPLIRSLMSQKYLAVLPEQAQISCLEGRNDKYTVYRIHRTVPINKQPECRYRVQ